MTRHFLWAAVAAGFIASAAAALWTDGSTAIAQGGQIPGVAATPIATAVVDFAALAAADQQRQQDAGPNQPTEGRFKEEGRYREPEVPDDPRNRQPAPHDFIPGPSIASPSPDSSFLGLDDIPHVGTGTSSIPPDTEGAVGLTRVLTSLNNNYRVLDKATGATVNTVSIGTFWSAVSGVSGPFDPKTIYDPFNDRFIVSAVSNAQSSTSKILIGISNTSDPNGTWTLHGFAACPGASPCGTGTEWWADYPGVGFNLNWAAVSVNMFTNSSNAFTQTRLLVVNYPELRSGAVPGSTMFTGITDFTVQPAITYSASEATLYAPNHIGSASRTYRLNTITGTAASPVYTPGASKTHSLVSAWVQPGGDILPQAPEPGTAAVRSIDVGDARILKAVFRNNAIWYAQTVGLPAGGPITHTAAQWVKLDTSGNALDAGRVDDPTATASNGGKWYAYPTIAVNANNDALIGFSQFSSAQFPSAAYAFRSSTDTAGTMRDVVIAKAGEGFYHKTFGGSANRWGDYSAVLVDPDDVSLWSLQQYSKPQVSTGNGSGRWSTWWIKIGSIAAFTDDPLTAGMAIRAIHITELRQRIDAVRATQKLGVFSYNDPTLTTGTTVVRAVHVTDLRTALQQAYEAAKLTPPTYTDSDLAPGTAVKAVHITDLRAAVVAIE
jgi:hypothetical protein